MDFNRELFQSSLLQGLKEWELDLVVKPQLHAVTRFVELVLETNRSLNLTRIVEADEMAIKNVLDSLAPLRLSWPSRQKCLDLGTGAGFPGIPLAICQPQWSWILLDSLRKRLRFLDQAAESLGMVNVATLHARAEDVGQAADHRESYDLVVSRAVASLPVLLELGTPLVKVGGVFAAYKGAEVEAELESASRAMEILKVSLERVFPLELPLGMGGRTILLFRKEAPTPSAYPRRAGIPEKRPLQ